MRKAATCKKKPSAAGVVGKRMLKRKPAAPKASKSSFAVAPPHNLVELSTLQLRAELVGTLKAHGKVFILHNGGNLGKLSANELHKVEVYTGSEKSYDFGYNEIDIGDEMEDSEGEELGLHGVRGAIEPYELQILGLYRCKSSAQKAAKAATCHRGTLAVSAVPVFGTAWSMIGVRLHVVKGWTSGQGVGACMLGVFTDASRAEARACQMIAGVKEVWGDPDYGCVSPGDDDYTTEIELYRKRGCFTVSSIAFYGYMDQLTSAAVEKHRLVK